MASSTSLDEKSESMPRRALQKDEPEPLAGMRESAFKKGSRTRWTADMSRLSAFNTSSLGARFTPPR